MKVLVAEDSKVDLILITQVLTEQGHKVVVVPNSYEAIEEYKRSKFDLVFLDVMMKEMDGFECAKIMRSLGREEWVPIIFLSQSIDDDSIAQGMEAGGDDYLVKPFSKITLIAKIKAIQRISDMQKKLYQANKKLKLLSATDTLTGIYNRFQFDKIVNEKLAIADNHKKQLALLFIDLDNFKIINDNFGHHIGDLLLKEVAIRLKSCVGIEDFVARIGGDEFAVILHDVKDFIIAGSVAQKILDTLIPDYYLNEIKIRVSASIGIALYPNVDTTHLNFVQNADMAMYHAKELGRCSYQYYCPELNKKYKQHIRLEQALQFALEKNELYLKYQPIMNLETNQAVGFESLICWGHPEYGAISPAIFIPIAEETGLIVPIGQWIIRQACKHAKQWVSEGFKNFKLGINVSSYQFMQENFYQNIIDILNEIDVSPHLLEFEITETTPMDYASQPAREIIRKLRDLGITISIDDFGTGYSSLTRLKDLAIDTLKIDQAFIRDALNDPNTKIIVKNLIDMSRELKLEVVAEGIETRDQLNYLLSLGCKKGQGYLLGKPMYAEQIIVFFQKQ